MIDFLRQQFLRVAFILSAGYFVGHSAATGGLGMWGIAVILVIIPLGISFFVPEFERFAQGIEVVVASMACLAMALGLLAATIGGSFNISPEVRPVFYGLAGMIVFGSLDVWRRRRKAKHEH
ncbi:MAG: hypothetical protein AAF385_08845 [Pseudomonadota bacterium]